MSTVTVFPELDRLLSSNAQWASDVSEHDPDFFPESAKGQDPKVLWIGCADSRVPESVIMACKPGEIFVHRNIANQFHLTDDSAQSVLIYAIEHLNVEHVIVAGHTKCGGVESAFDTAHNHNHSEHKFSRACASPLDRWLRPLVSLARSEDSEGMDRDVALTVLSEANVRAQVENICKSDVILRAWASAPRSEAKKNVYVHGWMYELQSGRLSDLRVSRGPGGLVATPFSTN